MIAGTPDVWTLAAVSPCLAVQGPALILLVLQENSWVERWTSAQEAQAGKPMGR